MRALTLAWSEDGGQVLGLAPSAAAAAVLGEQTGIRADTLANSPGHPPWRAARLGGHGRPSTLVIIDEAGMADTLTLDTAVQFALGRGANVRLVVMINNSPRSAPAVSSATSHTPRRAASRRAAPLH